jgi:DNA-binding transcriptional LysR family regulator
MRTYLAVVEAGSISAAARSLGLTQPAASQQLQELERQLGLRLLDRAAGRAVPTAAGQALIVPARRALAAAEDVVAAAAAHRSGDTGRVRLGTGATACIYLLPPALAAVRRRLPGIDIAVSTGNTAEVLRRVEDGELDLALVTLPVPRSRSLLITRLLTDPQLALVPDGMAAQVSLAARPAELARLPLILYETGGKVRQLTDGWFGRAGVTPRPAMELGNVEAIKGLVGSGLGCSILPSLALEGGVPGASVRPLRPALTRDLGLVLRKEKVVDRGLRAMLDELQKLVSERALPSRAHPPGA